MNEEKMQMEIDRQREEGRFNPTYYSAPESDPFENMTAEDLKDFESSNLW